MGWDKAHTVWVPVPRGSAILSLSRPPFCLRDKAGRGIAERKKWGSVRGKKEEKPRKKERREAGGARPPSLPGGAMEEAAQGSGHGGGEELPTPPAQGGPRVEALLARIRALHQACQARAQELAEAQGHSEELRRHLEQLEEQLAALEGLWQQQREALRVARLRWEEVEAEGQRRRQLCEGRQQDLEGAGAQRGRLRHLRRGHRQDFWRQLDALMEEHKRLQEAHSPAALQAELVRLEAARDELLRQEAVEAQLGPEARVATLAEELEQLQRPGEAAQ
ncbi:synaptonemal complex central element protein 1 isoform X2 [Anser cygnoides]|uniref:synaptonemal complex central element protein 1 isoform X2 n=1 Tax=Anser cygnoides TaxID=8845 RepID=UPI0034D2440F